MNHNIYKIKINNLHIGLYIRKENAEMGIWGSTNFTNTHNVIEQLSCVTDWTGEQTDKLIRIALENKQVKYILKDKDLKDFYGRICKNTDDEKAKAVIKILNT